MLPDLHAYIDALNWKFWLENGGDSVCHICKRTGVRTCDPKEAEIKCMVCGFCESDQKREAQKKAALETLKGGKE